MNFFLSILNSEASTSAISSTLRPSTKVTHLSNWPCCNSSKISGFNIHEVIIFNQKYGLNNLSEKDIRISFPNANSDPELSNWHSGISKRYKKNDLDFAFAEKCKELQIDLEIHFNASGHRRKEFEFRRWAFFFKEFKEKNNGKPPSQIAKDSFEKTLATLKQYYHKSYKKNDDV